MSYTVTIRVLGPATPGGCFPLAGKQVTCGQPPYYTVSGVTDSGVTVCAQYLFASIGYLLGLPQTQ